VAAGLLGKTPSRPVPDGSGQVAEKFSSARRAIRRIQTVTNYSKRRTTLLTVPGVGDGTLSPACRL
jgi:hypothetical protein